MPYKLPSRADKRRALLKRDPRCNKSAADKRRGSAHRRGYDATWRKVRSAKLRRNPICERCESLGLTTPATTVHHLQPVKSRPDLRLDLMNLQSLCAACHTAVHKGEGA